MITIYLEANAIQVAHRLSFSGEALRQQFEKQGHTPVVGMNTIYELARGFLHEENAEGTAKRFQIVRDLHPQFSQAVEAMMEQELTYYRTKIPVAPFLIGTEERKKREEVERLANGDFPNEAREFIEKYEQEFYANYPKLYQAHLEKVNRIKKDRPALLKTLTFEDALKDFGHQIPDLIVSRSKGLPSPAMLGEAQGITAYLENFRIIEATVRADILLTYLCMRDQKLPKKTRVGDFRHAIEAAYCDILVTDDQQFRNDASKVSPRLIACSFEDFLKL